LTRPTPGIGKKELQTAEAAEEKQNHSRTLGHHEFVSSAIRYFSASFARSAVVLLLHQNTGQR
jgi:hypothetical protein